jgi:hypothetical protein
MKKLLAFLIFVCFLSSGYAQQNHCGTKEQNDAIEKVCADAMVGMGAYAGAKIGGPAGGLAGGIVGSAVGSKLCHQARENHESSCNKNNEGGGNRSGEGGSNLNTDRAFGNKKSETSNCTAALISYRPKTRR